MPLRVRLREADADVRREAEAVHGMDSTMARDPGAPFRLRRHAPRHRVDRPARVDGGLRGARRRGAAGPLRAADRDAHGADEFDELDALLEAPCDRDAVTATRRRRELELLELEPLRPGVGRFLEDARDLGLRVGIVSSSSRAGSSRTSSGSASSTAGRRSSARTATRPLQAEPGALSRGARAARRRRERGDRDRGLSERHRVARAAGIFCVGFPNEVTSALDLSQADLVVESLEDVSLADLLERVG